MLTYGCKSTYLYKESFKINLTVWYRNNNIFNIKISSLNFIYYFQSDKNSDFV